MGTSHYNSHNEHDEERHTTGLPGQVEVPSSLLPTVLHRLGLDRRQEPLPLEALAGALRHPQWYVRAEALRALGTLSQQGHQVPPQLLLPALHDPHATVRIAAIHTLSLQGHDAPTQELLQALQDSEWIVREAAVLALERLGEPVPSVLLHDQDATVREVASAILQRNRFTSSTSPALPVSSTPEARPVGQLRRGEVAQRSLLQNVFSALFPQRKGARYTGAVMRETEYENGEYSPTLRSQRQPPRPSRRRRVQRVLTAGILVAVLAVSILGWAFVAQHFRPASSPGTTTVGRPAASPTSSTRKTPWRGPLGKSFYTYTCQLDNIHSVAWSNDSNRIAVGCLQLQAWDTMTREHPVNYGGQTNASVLSVGWSPDNKRIQASSQTVQVYDSVTGALLTTYQPASTTGSIAPSLSDGAGPLASYVPLSGGNMIYDSSWSPDGQLIASAVYGNQYGFNVQVWDSHTGQHLYTLQGKANAGPSDYITEARWSPDGRYIAFTEDNTVQVWSVATKQRVTIHADGNTFAWSPDSTLIVSAGQGSNVAEVWNATTNRTIYTYRGQASEQSGIRSVAWSPDGTRIASADTDIHLWDAITGNHVYIWKGYDNTPYTYIGPIAWSPDGTMIASAALGTLKVWIAA